jgi:hypothetical protein
MLASHGAIPLQFAIAMHTACGNDSHSTTRRWDMNAATPPETEPPQTRLDPAPWASLCNGLFVALVFLPCLLLLLMVLRHALAWRFYWDLPPLLYVGFLMDQFDRVPFRDLFDMNLIGSHLTYKWIGKIFGLTDLGIRWADTAFIMAIMASTVLLVRQMGFRVMLLAPFPFVFKYLAGGPSMTLQREFIAMPLIVLGAAVATALPRVAATWRALLAGVFFGAAATIKPHLVIGLPAVLWYLASEDWETTHGKRAWLRRAIPCAVWGAAGLALPLLGTAASLAWQGALADMWSMMQNYFPLYSTINGDLTVLPPDEFKQHLISRFLGMRRLNPLFMAGAAAMLYGIANPAYSQRVRRQVAMLMLLTLAYWIYPILGGKFWNYHDLPLLYFICTGMALSVGPWSAQTLVVQRIAPFVLVLVACAQTFGAFDRFTPMFPPAKRPIGGQPDAIAAYLKANLRPGDTVQPVDIVAGGVVHGLLMAKANLATPFIYWFHFYHHVSNPYIQQLRKRVMASLHEAPPRFIVQNTKLDFWIRGEDTATQFPEFDSFLKEGYVVALKERGFTIWEHRVTEATR